MKRCSSAILSSNWTNTQGPSGYQSRWIGDISRHMDAVAWSRDVAALVVDALIDRGLVRKDDFDQAVSVAAEEINVRLCMNDYPPRQPPLQYKPYKPD